MIKQTVIALLMMTGTAAATCGPQLTLDLDADDREIARSHGQHGGNSSGYNYGATKDDTEDFKFGIRLTIPLGEDYCEEQEKAKWERDHEYALRAELDNIEKTLRLCKQYGEHHPLLKGKCQ